MSRLNPIQLAVSLQNEKMKTYQQQTRITTLVSITDTQRRDLRNLNDRCDTYTATIVRLNNEIVRLMEENKRLPIYLYMSVIANCALLATIAIIYS